VSVKDAIGAELNVGDFVLINLDKPFVVGRVSRLNDGGVSIASPQGKQKPAFGVIEVISPTQATFPPGRNIPFIFKLTHPANQELASRLADEVNAGKVANTGAVAELKKPPDGAA
jgi:hypothetical protein